MRITISLILFLINSTLLLSQTDYCDTVLPAYENNTTIYNQHFRQIVTRGQFRICLKDTVYYQIKFTNLIGTPETPIEVVLEGDSAMIRSDAPYYGMKFENCRFVKLSGKKKNSDNRGLRIENINGIGITVDKLSSDFEIEKIHIENVKQVGIMVKTDPDCSYAATRDSFLLQNLSIHHNLIRKTGTEGMYIGHSFSDGFTINCEGRDTVVLPHLLENVRIFNNITDSTGWDGIQVSSSITPCEIYNNKITNDSYAEYYGQMSGIQLGRGSICNCFNNIVSSGYGNGIEIHSRGNITVYNNLVIRAGRKFKPGQQGSDSKAGIYVSYNLTNPGNLPYLFINNSIISPKSDGIRFANVNSENNKFINNIILNPGTYEYYLQNHLDPETSYIHMDAEVSTTELNNIKTLESYDLQFVDEQNDDYHILKNSEAYNAGLNVSFYGIDYDLDSNVRPSEELFDIGAYEYQHGQIVEEISGVNLDILQVKYIPEKGILVRFENKNSNLVGIEVFATTGIRLAICSPQKYNEGIHEAIVHIPHLSSEIIFLRVTSGGKAATIKIPIL